MSRPTRQPIITRLRRHGQRASRSRAAGTSVALLAAATLTVAGGPAAADPRTLLDPLPALVTADDAFYVPPTPLPDGKPGDLIRAEDIALSTYLNARAQKVMYLSTNNRGKHVAVTGLLLTPLNQQAGNNNPLVVHTPGTRGLADRCAPSKQADLLTLNPTSPEYAMAEYLQFLLKGISVIVSDYLGAGTPDLPEYLVGRSEGYNGLDALRAAMQVPGSGVSRTSPVGISGYSQGGQAAGWAAELQPSYAPELRLEGVLAGGVPTDVLAVVNHLNGNPIGSGVPLAALIGLDAANPELGLDDRLTPRGRQVVEQVENSCYPELIAAFGTTTVADVSEPDVLADPRWQKRFTESLLGTAAPGAPAYIVHGSLDIIVPFDQGSHLYHEWCRLGADVIFESTPAVDHVSTSVVGMTNGVNWLADRLHDVEADQGCHEVGLS
ncbi:lipase family protein [Nocardioides sp. NPDC006273]|uniref:lipase family protein n=1 Tax=Nocardioides sp. NPDC006273 TaxID=3155598 RepID=UPI00339F556C